MTWIADKLRIDPFKTCQQIEEFLRKKLSESGRQGYLLGLSGGLDSAIVAYLTVRAVGSQRTVFLNLPDWDSKPLHIQHVQTFSQALGVELQTVEITPLIQTSYPVGITRKICLVPSRLPTRFCGV
jgi:NAD+ synthase